MNLNHLITAADFLYSHSPAFHVSDQRNVIAVAGPAESGLADAFFELLFSTACRNQMKLRLIRLCPRDAQQKELDFLCRNEAGISAFARNEFSSDSRNRPLSIHFLDAGDPLWESQKEHLAWAVSLGPERLQIPCSPCFAGEEIPGRFPGKEEWSSSDERDCEVLRIARRAHSAYTAGWNSRYTEAEISEDLYGRSASARAYYCLRSSLRLAVSIPWKLSIAGLQPAPGLSGALCRRLSDGGKELMNQLAWQEHRSWYAFMTLEGWAPPSEAEMRAYLYRDGNDHRQKSGTLLHPCLCDLHHDDWNDPHPRSLRNMPIHAWSAEYAAHLEEYCLLDQMSLTLHHLCRETVVSPEYALKVHSLFRNLEGAILRAGSVPAEELLPRVRWLEGMFSRLRGNETNSRHPWHQACSSFESSLRQAAGDACAEVLSLFQQIRREAEVAAERNSYTDYREIDTKFISWLPWILLDEGIGTVWKLYSGQNLLSNLLSSVILRPERLVLVCREQDASKVPVARFQDLLLQHGLPELSVSVLPLPDPDSALVPSEAGDVIDVTDCGDLQNRVRFPSDARVVFYGDDDLQDDSNSPFLSPVFHPYDFVMNISEMLRLQGQDLLSASESNDMLGMDQDYELLWQTSREIHRLPGPVWHYTIQAVQKAEGSLTRLFYPGSAQDLRQFSLALTPVQAERISRNGAAAALHELQECGCLADLFLDLEHLRLSCGIYPSPEGPADRWAEADANLRGLVEESSENDAWTVVHEYVRHGEPYRIVNLRQPVCFHYPSIADRIIQGEEKRGKRKAASLLSEENRQKQRDVLIRMMKDGITRLVSQGLLISAGKPGTYTWKSLPVRRELEKEGYALEAYTYYSLFLSGLFDDVRSNLRVAAGFGASGDQLEKELDIMISRKGKMGLISCKDTQDISPLHIGELKMQAELYGINARPILVCSLLPPSDIVTMCNYLQVGLIHTIGPDLPGRVLRALGA